MAQDDYIRTALRVPPDLHKQIHASAEKAGRSFNAELVYLLERGLKSPDAFIPAPRSVMSVDKSGNYIERTPRELLEELSEHIRRALMITGVFEAYSDGEPEMPDISQGPDWAVDPEVVPIKRNARKTKPKTKP